MIFLREIRLAELPETSYISKIPAVRQLYSMGKLEFHAPVTMFVGENGSGKSTLMEGIAVAMGFNAEGGSRDFDFSTKATHSELGNSLKTVRNLPPKDGFFLRAESFYNAVSYLDDSGSLLTRYGGVSLHQQSHGESFLSLVLNRFEGNGLYILDEPEAALSPQNLMALLVAMDELVRKKNSQLILATHSPILMAFPGAELLKLDENGISPTTLRETDHFFLTKAFTEDPEGMIARLLSGND